MGIDLLMDVMTNPDKESREANLRQWYAEGNSLDLYLNLQEIYKERLRQEELKAKGKFHWTCRDLKYGPSEGQNIMPSDKLAVLAEEFGEVSKLIVESIIQASRYNPRELKKELIQVAAVCVAWCEAIDEEICYEKT